MSNSEKFLNFITEWIDMVCKCRKSFYFHFVILYNMCAEGIPSKVVQYEQFLNERLKADLR